jgi:hypothetical protein
LRNFLCDKKSGNARRKLLAYPSFACVQTMQNGKVDFVQFPIVQEKERILKHEKNICRPSSDCNGAFDGFLRKRHVRRDPRRDSG